MSQTKTLYAVHVFVTNIARSEVDNPVQVSDSETPNSSQSNTRIGRGGEFINTNS